MIERSRAWRWIGGVLATASAALLTGCGSGPAAAEDRPEPIEISEADQRVNPNTDPLNGDAADEPASQGASSAGQVMETAAPQPVERVTLAGGLVIEDLREGQGPALLASEGVTITVHYVGRVADDDGGPDGATFDTTYTRGQPVTLELDRLIRGWRQGLPGMRVGGLRRLTIPPEMAYGPEGHLNVPGGATVVYEVLLLGYQ